MNRADALLVCPICGYQSDALAAIPWGNLGYTRADAGGSSVMPFICGGCAGLMAMRRMQICGLPAFRLFVLNKEQWDYVAANNPTLWKAITDAQDKVRASMNNPEKKPRRTGIGTVYLTDHEELMRQAAASIMNGKGPMHPTLSRKPLGQMTDGELREFIAWHSRPGV